LVLLGIVASQGTSLANGFGFAAIGSLYAVVSALVVGVPAYLLARRFAKPNVWLSILLGTFVASAPWVIFALFSPELMMAAVLGAPLGALGGLVFWAVALRPLTQAG